MADFARIQNRIYTKGYEKSAIHLGTEHTIYRSTDGIDPLKDDNLFGTRLISVDQNYKYTTTKKYGDSVWQFLMTDGLTLRNYDYFVSPSGTIYFIADIAPDNRLNPPLCVECNKIITITRPTQPTGIGAVDYGAYLPSTATELLVSCPASVLEGTKGEANAVKFPLDTRSPYYEILLPYLGGVNLRIGDFIADQNDYRLVISSVELTGLGWRLQAGSVAA
jgi:hypothetical protein